MRRNILMADIIHSGKKDSIKLMKDFKFVVNKINHENPDLIVSPLTITLGDEFQGLVTKFQGGMELIFQIEELIIQRKTDFKLRYVLIVGEVKTPINRGIAYEMLGEGLSKAREKISEMKKSDLRFYASRNKLGDDILNSCFTIYQNIVDSWKSKDLNAVSAFLKYADYKRVAEEIGIDASSAWRRKKSLRINEYNSIKQILIYLINHES